MITRRLLLRRAAQAAAAAGLPRAGHAAPLPWLPRVVGDRWAYAVSYQSPLTRMDIQARLRCLGAEPVPTPAGRFEALRVQQSITTRLTPAAGLPAAPLPAAPLPATEHVQEDDLYFARGVGLVLSLTDNGDGYAAMKVLPALQRL